MMKKIFLISCVLMLASCSGLNKKIFSVSGNQGQPSCDSNPYLKAYHCSLSAVQAVASKGNPDAQYALGYMYFYGIGTDRNPALAASWIKKAAGQGQALAIRALGLINKQAVQGQQTAHADAITGATTANNSTVSVSPASSSSAIKSDASITSSGLSRVVVSQPAQLSSNPSVGQLKSGDASLNYTGYAVQLMMSHSLAAIQKFSTKFQLSGPMNIFENHDAQGLHYILTLGNFTSKDQARQAISHLPLQLRGMNPWVRSLSGLKIVTASHT